MASTKFRLDELRPMFNDLPRRRRSAEIDDLLDEIRILIKSMERHLAALSLEGPSELNYLATLVTGGARLLHARLERWREEYSDVTIPSTGEQEYEELKKGFEDKIERAGYLASVHV
ncbi:hypothetical protein GTZ89_08425 [Streptomyces sp. SID8382]|uniref:hypothetical protein n=1 Tax=Streptomyces malaysiensis TaxID=92644 RepID=UPI0013319447|nr:MULTISPECIES: hypothetical protein [unclassified Streptomyces]MYX55741.1 hypothetical protein [Streptomyces sp. SID8382]